MSELSEEEIIKYIEDEIADDTDTFHWFDDAPNNETRKQIKECIDAHQGLLDLYRQEKEKNKILQSKLDLAHQLYNDSCICIAKDCIEKDKIKEKIEETNSEKLNYSEDEYYLENEVKGYAIDKLKELLEDK